MNVMHLCDNPACFLYAHLRLGTHAENMADMAAKGRHGRPNALLTHCKHGHEFTPENTYVAADGHRSCRTCKREAMRRYRKFKGSGYSPWKL